MPFVEIPINGEAYKNVDSVALSNKSEAIVDAYIDEAGDTVKRPGLESFVDLGTALGVDGLYYWKNIDKLFAVSGGKVFTITEAGTVTDITTDTMSIGVPVVFANNGTYVVMANGGRMAYTDGTANTAYIGDADAPTTVTHVAFLDTYIIANETNSNSFYWSDVGDILNWSALSFASAEGSSDYLRALAVSFREITLWGDRSVEVWYNDGTTPFSRLQQGFSEGGIAAANSPVFADNTWFYLDHERRVVRLSGRTPKRISGQYDKVIQKMGRVNDAIGMAINIEGQPFYVITFPSENTTLAFNYATDTWTQWGYWKEGVHERFLGNCHETIPDWGLHLVGDRNSGVIYKMSEDYLDDGGDEIRMLRRTGNIDHGTYSRKRSSELILKMKRGYGKTDNLDPNDVDSMPYVSIRWRDNGGDTWSKEKFVKLNRVGDYDFLARMTRMGIYRTRQYEIAMSDRTPFVLVGAKENIEVLE